MKLKSLTEIEKIMSDNKNFFLICNQIQGFINLILKVSRDTNNNVVVASLKILN